MKQAFFQNLFPRILAESRKVGVSMILSHQHTAQLPVQIREALEANTANFIAFRLSPRDAAVAAIRFDDPEMQAKLTRIDAFKAITTLSVDGKQTDPFTLEIEKPTERADGDQLANEIERNSIETLVKPYYSLKALTRSEIVNLLNNPDQRGDLGIRIKKASGGAKETNFHKVSNRRVNINQSPEKAEQQYAKKEMDNIPSFLDE